MSLRPVNPSFEIGGSVFNSLTALRGLIAATSEDDVHTQAVLAVEQLGACIPAAPERIDEAVNALGGQNSIRVQNVKAAIGISSGGLCKVMRQSTPLFQFFVLCAACKTTLLDEECSTLMFEMLKTSSVLAKLPCSAVQIMRMITQFSGQAEMIAPADMMHEVASALDEWNPEPDTIRKMDFSFEEVEKCVKIPCQAFTDSHFSGEKVEVDYILDPALFVAADAAVTCTACFERGGRFIKPLDDEILRFADETVMHILSDGLEVSEFRKSAFKQLLPGLDTWHDGDLVVARDGYVAGMNMLWTESARHSDALSIRVQGAQIKKDQIAYHSIRENPFNSIVFAGPRVPAFDAVKGLVMPEVGWQHPIKDRAYTFETSASVHGTRIDIKHYMAYTNSLSKLPQRRKASWVSAINVLATATHMDLESQLTAKLSAGFNMRLTQQLMSKDVCWTDPFASPKVEREVRTLMRAGANSKVKIFGAGTRNDPRDICCHIVIRHQSPLLQCIEKAESSVGNDIKSWTIVA